MQIIKIEHKNFPKMYHLSYLDIKHWNLEGKGIGFRNRNILKIFKFLNETHGNSQSFIKKKMFLEKLYS